MSTDLRGRLELLAARAPEPAAAGKTADLWRRARVRHLRRTAAGVAATLVLALVAGVGLSTLWSRIPDARPAGDTAKLVLPDQFFTPSPWLPGTDDKGPIGPLVAVIGAEREDWLGRSSTGMVGVSADGTYRFLDLPYANPYADVTDMALSADGRWLAYLWVGEPGGEPKLQPGNVLPYVGIAIYDTVTGQLQRQEIGSRHGVMAGPLAWSGDVVWFSYSRYEEGGGGFDGGGGQWSGLIRFAVAEGGLPTVHAFRNSVEPGTAGPAPGGMVVRASLDRRGFALTRGAQRVGYLEPDTSLTSQAVSPDGRSLAGVHDPTPGLTDGAPLPLMVGEVSTTPGEGRPMAVPMREIGASGLQVLGWRDATHVVVLRNIAGRAQIDSIDVATGASVMLARPRNGSGGGEVFASDIWQADRVDAVEPDWPMDPRLRALWWTLGIAVVVGLVVLLRRRRVRP